MVKIGQKVVNVVFEWPLIELTKLSKNPKNMGKTTVDEIKFPVISKIKEKNSFSNFVSFM